MSSNRENNFRNGGRSGLALQRLALCKRALRIADAFTRATGYVLMDIKPGNITF